MASYATVFSAVYGMLEDTPDEDMKQKVAKAYTDRIVANPVSLFNDTVNSLFSNVGLTKASDIGQTLLLAIQEYSDAENTDVGKKLAYNDMYGLLQRQFAALQTGSDVAALYDSASFGGGGKSLKDVVANALGTVSGDNVTRG